MYVPRRCNRCVLPENIPGIRFDENGICNICSEYEKSFINWADIEQHKLEQFENLIASAKKLHRQYDCLIPLSGGKDSTYTLYLCSKIYSLICLAVTFDNGFLTNQAKKNINNALEKTNSDHFLYQINKAKTLDLYKLFLSKSGGFCNACMRSINYSLEIATQKFNIPLIIKGSGKRVQYVSQTGLSTGSNSSKFFENIIKGEAIEKDYKNFFSNKKTFEYYKFIGIISDFMKIPRTRLMRFIPQYIGIYDYLYKPYTEIIPILKSEMGWEKSDEAFEHLDCALHDIPFYIQTIKIPGITTETLHNSGLIRQGLMTRDEAMKIENEKLSISEPPKDLKKFLKDIGIELREFENYIKNNEPKEYQSWLEKCLMDLYIIIYYEK